jgi:predicted DsbA family dithiol-disulfide isomerase
LNISDVAVLREISSGLGLDPDEAERVLTEGDYRSAVDEDWQYALKAGVTAVPTFLAGGRTVVGAQPYEVLQRLVSLARDEGSRRS